MVNSKNALKKEIKNGRKLEFLTLANEYRPKNIGLVRSLGKQQQTNAFTLATEINGTMKDSFIWYDDITVSNNLIRFKNADIVLQILEI